MKDSHRKKIHEIIDEAVDDLKPIVRKVADKSIDMTEYLIDDLVKNLFTSNKNSRRPLTEYKGGINGATKKSSNS